MTHKIALVIGGSGGIGTAVIARLRADGMHVFSTYHQRLPLGDDSSMRFMDVTNIASVKKSLHAIFRECTKINTVVYTVSAPLVHVPILQLTWQEFERHIAIQLQGFFHVVQELREQILEKHKIKFIVILSEVCIGRPPAQLAHYTAAKYALMGFVKTAAIDLGRFGCCVNMVSPGIVATELTKSFPPKAMEIAAAGNPLGRIATPEDVANAVALLASSGMDYLNGVHITVNGGGIMV